MKRRGVTMKSSIRHFSGQYSDSSLLLDLSEIDLPGLPRILVVDDEKSLLNLIYSILHKNGFCGDRALTLKDACCAISRKTYDIVFLDLGLPDGSGFTILQKVIDSSPAVLVIVITGVHDLQTAVRSIREGAFDYITKPFSVTLFQERLNTVIDEWKSRSFTRSYQKYLEKMVRERTSELSNTIHEIEHIYDMTVYALGAALDLRDPETEDHCKRVSENSILLGERLGIKGKKARDLKWGAYLHDIGKIGIPESILQKEGSLTEGEMSVVKRHSFLGHSMIKNIEFLTKACDVVLYHHEKYDGSGYPLGLEGRDIPLFARIFAIVDAFDAMIVDRPYRKKLLFEEAINELKVCCGTHFDPELVETFLYIPVSQLGCSSSSKG
jgi:putative nucleotidyltransferase with HDIG domain